MRPPESFIEQPVRSLQTMLRVIAEDDPSLPTVIPDGVYGPATMNAVTAFQRHHALPVTGIVDQYTWEQVVAVYEPAAIRVGKAEPIEILMDPGQVYSSGDSGAYIFLLQSMLTQLSQDTPQISAPGHSGIMDAETQASLSAFQSIAGLTANGQLDKVTWKHLVLHFTANAHHAQAIQLASSD